MNRNAPFTAELGSLTTAPGHAGTVSQDCPKLPHLVSRFTVWFNDNDTQ